MENSGLIKRIFILVLRICLDNHWLVDSIQFFLYLPLRNLYLNLLVFFYFLLQKYKRIYSVALNYFFIDIFFGIWTMVRRRVR